MKYLILIVSIVVSFIACIKSNGSIVMKYEQTQCADKWGYGANDNETKTRLSSFLDSAGIIYTDLKFAKVNPGAVCLACNCVTGGLFTLETTEPFVAALTNFGFKRK